MSTSTSSSAVFLAVILLLSAAASAFNITRILEQYPDFSTFNALLSSTTLAGDINKRTTITVLALTNDRAGELASKPVDVQKRILSTHIVLDYFDGLKLSKLKEDNKSNIITTLYQSTGVADDMQGFLAVVHATDGSIYFGSAMKGAPIDAKLQGSVAKQPYNISVLSISHVIIAPGIDGSFKPVTAPPPSPKAPAPVAPAPADAPAADEPTPADAPAEADAPAPADAPADAPDADAPAPDMAPEDAPADQTPPAGNGAGREVVSGVLVGLVVAVACFVAGQ